MIFLVKKFFWVGVGALGALQVDRWLSRQKVRLSPRAMTGSLLDRLNQSLENRSR